MADNLLTFDEHTTVTQFRDEFQHRIVKYPIHSRPVKEARRFARRHTNPEFHRIAEDKVHAQAQHRRELNGPSRWERAVDFLNGGSLREIGVTLALVTVACLGIETTRAWFGARRAPAQVSDAEVERLAKRMGFYLVDQVCQSPPPKTAPPAPERIAAASEEADRLLAETIQAAVDEALAKARLDEAVSRHLERQLGELKAELAEKVLAAANRSQAPAIVENAVKTTPAGPEGVGSAPTDVPPGPDATQGEK